MDYRVAIVNPLGNVTVESDDELNHPSIILNSGNLQEIISEPDWGHYQISAEALKDLGEITIEFYVSSFFETGSFATESFNMTGDSSVKGTIVRFVAGPSGQPNSGFILADYEVQVPHDAICLDNNVPDGGSALVAIGGIVDVLMVSGEDWEAGDYIKLSPTVPGRGENAGPSISTTDYIIGKCLVDKEAGDEFATILFARSGTASSYNLYGNYSDSGNFEQLKLEATPGSDGLIKVGTFRVGSGRELPFEIYGKEFLQAYGNNYKIAKHSYLLSTNTHDDTQKEMPLDGRVVQFIPHSNPGVYWIRAYIQALSMDIQKNAMFEITAAVRNGTIHDKSVTTLFASSGYGVSVDLDITTDRLKFLVTGLPLLDTVGVSWGGFAEVFENRE